jgi:hypothetical protein
VPRIHLDTRVSGLNEVIRALERLPSAAQREARRGAVKISRDLANAIRATARASDRQSAVAGRTVRTATEGLNPAVIAGPHPLLFGSNFGALGRFGWYSKHRYINSRARQFRAHVGQSTADYWFFSTQVREEPRLQAGYQAIADAIIRDWSA